MSDFVVQIGRKVPLDSIAESLRNRPGMETRSIRCPQELGQFEVASETVTHVAGLSSSVERLPALDVIGPILTRDLREIIREYPDALGPNFNHVVIQLAYHIDRLMRRPNPSIAGPEKQPPRVGPDDYARMTSRTVRARPRTPVMAA